MSKATAPLRRFAKVGGVGAGFGGGGGGGTTTGFGSGMKPCWNASAFLEADLQDVSANALVLPVLVNNS